MDGGLPNHYGALEVPRDADENAIKKSYRKKVLLWHPDKHPTEPELAEQRIREINGAYDTLSNPQKRGQYDQQLFALERRAQGVRINTTSIQPRMSIPKEFMLCPMGHPDKFVRSVGSAIFVHSREDTNVGFQDFFKEAKFSLWWMPQRNNMNHIRSQSSAGQGVRGGLNITFAVSDKTPMPETMLSHVQGPETFFIAVASPELQGAFRFEAAFFPGYYLAFKPPTHLQVVNTIENGLTVADFVLVDYASTFRYMTLEEVLTPVVEGLGGSKDYVNLSAVREDNSIRLHFQNVLKKNIWSPEDFETYFAGHYQHWDFDAINHRVRIRSKQERTMHALRRARTLTDVASIISGAGDELSALPIDMAEAVLATLQQPLTDEANVTACVNYLTAQKNVLAALHGVYLRAPLARILAVYPRVVGFGGEHAPKDLASQSGEAARALARIVSDQISQHGIRGGELTFDCIGVLCGMPLDWETCGLPLRQSASQFLSGRPIEELLPLLRSAIKASAQQLSECVATAIWEQFGLHATLDPAIAVEALDAIVAGGLSFPWTSGALRKLHRDAPFGAVACVAAALAENGAHDEDLNFCIAFLAGQQQQLQALPAATLLRLTVAATKSTVVSEGLVEAVAEAATATLQSWTMDDVSKLLLATAKAKTRSESSRLDALFGRAAEVIAPQLPALSAVQLIKIVLAVGKVAACRSLLNLAAEEATQRVSSLPDAQLLLLMQGLLPLGTGHPSLIRILDLLGDVGRSLAADQLAKLLLLLLPCVPAHHVCDTLASLLDSKSQDLSPTGLASLEAGVATVGEADFMGKKVLLRMFQKAKEPHRCLNGSRETRRSPSGSCSRERRERRRRRSRNRSRSGGRRRR